MCKEMPVIPVNRVVDKKRIIRKNGGARKRRGTIFAYWAVTYFGQLFDNYRSSRNI
jgi:hypothetical protein